MELVIETPEWAIPLLFRPAIQGAYGGRGSGTALFAELLVEEHVANPEPAFRLYPRNPEVSPLSARVTDCLQDSGAWRPRIF